MNRRKPPPPKPMPPNVRQGEESAGLTVIRYVPIPWLVGGACIAIAQGALWWYQLLSQGDSLKRQETSQATIVQELAEIRKSLNTTNLKDLEHDLRINTLTNRVQAIEQVLPRQFAPLVAPANGATR